MSLGSLGSSTAGVDLSGSYELGQSSHLHSSSSLAIIAEGGAMRGAFTYGVVRALDRHFGLKHADYYVGSSSGIPTLLYHVTQQLDAGDVVWGERVTLDSFVERPYVGLPRVNLDFLINLLREGDLALSEEQLLHSGSRITIPIADVQNGRPLYVSVTDGYVPFTFNDDGSVYPIDGVENLFNILRVAMKLPLVCGGPERLYGRLCSDGGGLDTFPFDVPVVRKTDHGYDVDYGIEDARKIFILTKPIGHASKLSFLEKLFFYNAMRNTSREERDILKRHPGCYQYRVSQIQDLRHGHVLITPDKDLDRMRNDPEYIAQMIRHGEEKAIENEDLQALMSDLREKDTEGMYFKPPSDDRFSLPRRSRALKIFPRKKSLQLAA